MHLIRKIEWKEVMILQLEQIALNYGKTPEGEKAKEMLNYLKSDLSFQATDNKGNSIPQNPGNSGSNIPQQPMQQNNEIGKTQKMQEIIPKASQ
jgi:hypothetical protein